jgi:DNA-directed RNA polymerase subunit RPC12/RpoP
VTQFHCSNCQRLLETPDDTAGVRFACPVCGQQMEVPVPPPQPRPVAATVPIPDPFTPITPQPLVVSTPRELPVRHDEPRRDRPRRRDDDDDDHDDGRGRRRGRRRESIRHGGDGFACPYCGSDAPPRMKSEVSAAGWVLFVILIVLVCWPLCWIGLLIKDEYRVCRDCGVKLG